MDSFGIAAAQVAGGDGELLGGRLLRQALHVAIAQHPVDAPGAGGQGRLGGRFQLFDRGKDGSAQGRQAVFARNVKRLPQQVRWAIGRVVEMGQHLLQAVFECRKWFHVR